MSLEGWTQRERKVERISYFVILYVTEMCSHLLKCSQPKGCKSVSKIMGMIPVIHQRLIYCGWLCWFLSRSFSSNNLPKLVAPITTTTTSLSAQKPPASAQSAGNVRPTSANRKPTFPTKKVRKWFCAIYLIILCNLCRRLCQK